MIYQGDAFAYIMETPDILFYILENQNKIFKDSMEFLKDKNISEIYLAGSGSSFNGASAACLVLQRILGIRVFAVTPVPFLQNICFSDKDALFLGISQQGTSSAVIHTMDEMRCNKRKVISVTGEYDTEITRHGDVNLYVECGYEDAGATTKGYTATVFTLFLFGLLLARQQGKLSQQEYSQYQQRLKKVIFNMKYVLERSGDWASGTAEKLKGAEELLLLAGGNQSELMLEGVLKFSETCRFPVRGYEAEDFMHGMYNAVGPQTQFLYLFPSMSGEQAALEKIYGYYKNKGNIQYTINRPGDEWSGCFVNDRDFSILEFALPLQMLFVLTSRKRGIDMNIPRDPEFHKYMGSKLEKGRENLCQRQEE